MGRVLDTYALDGFTKTASISSKEREMKNRKNEFCVHCILCGKNFYKDTEVTCGGLYSGKPMCKTSDIEREMNKRLPKAARGGE